MLLLLPLYSILSSSNEKVVRSNEEVNIVPYRFSHLSKYHFSHVTVLCARDSKIYRLLCIFRGQEFTQALGRLVVIVLVCISLKSLVFGSHGLSSVYLPLAVFFTFFVIPLSSPLLTRAW